MKITFEDEHSTASVKLPEDCDIHQIVDTIVGLLVIKTFCLGTIKKGFEAYLEEHDEKDY